MSGFGSAAPDGAGRFARTRGRTGSEGLQYPSPFFDIGQTYLLRRSSRCSVGAGTTTSSTL